MNAPLNAPPTALLPGPGSDLEYAGFWVRVVAALVDTVWVLALTAPLLIVFYGWSSLMSTARESSLGQITISYVLPAAIVLLFWRRSLATPGKMAIDAKIVDARTGLAPTNTQLVIRYLGYFVSSFPLLLGLIWVGFDARKRGWHDLLARTVVVRRRDRSVPGR